MKWLIGVLGAVATAAVIAGGNYAVKGYDVWRVAQNDQRYMKQDSYVEVERSRLRLKVKSVERKLRRDPNNLDLQDEKADLELELESLN